MKETLLLIIGFAVVFIVSINLYWEEFSARFKHEGFKYKNGRPVLPEHLLDVWVISSFLSLLVARAAYVFFNLSDYAVMWSLTPWVRNDDGKMVWLTRFPWIFIDFFRGEDLAVFLFALIAFLVFFLIRKQFDIKVWFMPFRKGILGMVLGMQVFALFIKIDGFSSDTVLEGSGFLENLLGNLYFLIGVGLSIVYLLTSKFFLTEDKGFKLRVVFFAVYISLVLLLVKLTQDYDVSWLYLVPAPLAVGLLYFAFAKESMTESELLAELGKTKKLPGVRLDVKAPRGRKKK